MKVWNKPELTELSTKETAFDFIEVTTSGAYCPPGKGGGHGHHGGHHGGGWGRGWNWRWW